MGCKGEMGSQGVQQPGNESKGVQQPGNVVSKNVSAPTEVEVDVKSVSVPTEAESVSAPTEVELTNNEGIIINVAPTQFGDCNLASKNVSAPTEVECGVSTDPEGEKQMPSLAPSSKGVTIVNIVSKQHRDYNLVSKNLSVLTRAKYIKTHKIKC